MNFYEPRMRELNAFLPIYNGDFSPVHMNEVHLQDTERILGTRLPEDYREFIADFGFFHVPTIVFPAHSGWNPSYYTQGNLGVFLGINPENSQSNADIVDRYSAFGLLATYSWSVEALEDWPSEWMNIGSGDSTIYVALAIKGQDKGSVHTFDNGELARVADSFDEFMRIVTPAHTEPREIQAAQEIADAFWATFSTS